MKVKNILSIFIATCALISISYLTPNIDGLSANAKTALGIAAFAIIIWITEALEDVLSGFVLLFLLCITQTTSVNEALIGYSNSALWLIVIGFIMAAAMEKSGLSKRIALTLLNFSQGSVIRIYWLIAAVMFILTFLVPSITARVLLMLPIVLGIARAFNCKRGKSNAVKAMLFIVAISGTMMSMGVITAHAANPITAGLIEKNLHVALSWSMWFKVAAPPAFLLALISILLICLIWRPEKLNAQEARTYIAQEIATLGKFTQKEIYTLIVFSITLILWASDSIHKTPILIVGIMSAIALLLPKYGSLTWSDAQKHIPWSVFILYGAGLSMGMALVNTQAAKWIAGIAFAPLIDLSPQIQLVCIIWFVTFLQIIFTGGGPKATALMPIIISFAMHSHFDPVIFSLIIGINMLHQYLLPVNNMPNVIILGSGYVHAKDIIMTGAIMSLMVFTYWQWI